MPKTTKTTEKKETKHGVVFGGALNVRKDAKMTADIVKVLENGAEIEILDELDGFYKIKGGFVKADFVKIAEK